MATNFESIYEKFLLQIDDYELGIIQDYELNNICFGYLEKARALYFPQCSKNLDDVTINNIEYVNGVRIEPVVEEETPVENETPTEEPTENVEAPIIEGEGEESSQEPAIDEETPVVEDGEEPIVEEETPVMQTFSNEAVEPVEEETPAPTEGETESTETDAVETPSEDTVAPTEDENSEDDILVDEGENSNTEPLEGDSDFVVIEGYFNEDLTNSEQYILALGMKKAWLSSKKYSADLMSKDIGDRDYKAVQGFNYIKELRSLDSELEDEIRKYGVQYTYSIEELTNGW